MCLTFNKLDFNTLKWFEIKLVSSFTWKLSFSDQPQLYFFLSGLLWPSDWKCRYLPVSVRDIRCSTNGNIGLLKWVWLLLEQFAPGNLAGLWGTECCTWTQTTWLFLTQQLWCQRSRAWVHWCLWLQYRYQRMIPSLFLLLLLTLQVAQLQHLESFSCVQEKISGCILKGSCWCAFLPVPMLILHNMGCLPSPLLYKHCLFKKIFCRFKFAFPSFGKAGCILTTFGICTWKTEAAYPIAFDLASAKQLVVPLLWHLAQK